MLGPFTLFALHYSIYFSSVVKWLEHHVFDQYYLGSKPTHSILLCPWERHFMALSPPWWSWQAVLNFNHISMKLQADSYILASLGMQVGVIGYPMY